MASNINPFLQQKFLTKICHIMVPDCRDFDKDFKKYLFAILGLFYEISIDFTNSLQKFKNKTNIMFRPLDLQKTP